ncbi:Putative peptidoglycan binding domain-containing protein [Acetitomaculum ruminis DSM 5522]|uniref:Putative peptidoglycan binding domain-containing protein n=1 Tax=Acetitomaculum ruminis DSM 5522 TaxID=1120918 RepID=A0A1I0WLR7_9FIRM|nr:L,D-transpeptidase family protein [Acetitomaculum ruminis]SFA89100.1 Putative peptidoglycan binding domain-containing protein [Acetitomaculum ruminis DSM 5522]
MRENTVEGSINNEMPGKKSSHKKAFRIAMIILGVIVVVIAGVYLKIAIDYNTHFFKGTMINNIDVSGMTLEEAENELKADAKKYSITINFRGGVTDTISSSDIDYRYEHVKEVTNALEEQNIFSWPANYITGNKNEISVDMVYNEEMLTNLLNSYDTMKAENMIPPTNAYVSNKDGNFEIAEETYGNQLDTETVINAAKEAVSNSLATINIEDVENAYATPSVYKDDEGLTSTLSLINTFTSASITYDLPGGNEVLDKATTIDWLMVDENGAYTYDEANIDSKADEYITQMKAKVQKHTFKTSSSGDINIGFTVRGYSSDCGWWIDKASEVSQMLSELKSGTVTERQPVWGVAPFTLENNGYGYDYVEIDISSQHLWVYKSSNLVFETDIVSGAMVKERYTPTGIYKVAWKERDHVLKGDRRPDGSYEYETKVSYWLPFITDIGIGMHDATWQSSFGGDRYMTGNGSHGCINLSMSSVARIYSLVEKGTPVIVYYSKGCPLE